MAKTWVTGDYILADDLNNLSELAEQNATSIALIQEALPTYVGERVPRQDSQTIVPGNSDQTIGAGVYLTGEQIIKGDANLLASNIKDGVTIFGKTGSYSGDASAPELQTKTITPTENRQSIGPDAGYDGLLSVTVNAISNMYIGSAVTKKGSQSYTPTKNTQTIASGQYLTGVQTINPIPNEYIVPSGTKNITSNGTHNVAGFESVTIDVPTSGGSGGTNYEDGRSIYYTGRI